MPAALTLTRTGKKSGRARSFERDGELHRRRGRRSARIRTWAAVSHLVTAAAPDAGELLQEPAPVRRRLSAPIPDLSADLADVATPAFIHRRRQSTEAPAVCHRRGN